MVLLPECCDGPRARRSFPKPPRLLRHQHPGRDPAPDPSSGSEPVPSPLAEPSKTGPTVHGPSPATRPSTREIAPPGGGGGGGGDDNARPDTSVRLHRFSVPFPAARTSVFLCRRSVIRGTLAVDRVLHAFRSPGRSRVWPAATSPDSRREKRNRDRVTLASAPDQGRHPVESGGGAVPARALFPHSRSPNPACRFPAPGSPVGSCFSHTDHRPKNGLTGSGEVAPPGVVWPRHGGQTCKSGVPAGRRAGSRLDGQQTRFTSFA